jgi:hypothetical protein
MTLPRAVQLAQGVALRTVDYVVEPFQGVLTAAGTLQITADYVQPDQIWRIERLVVESTTANQLTLKVTDGTHTRDYGIMPAPAPLAFPQVAEYPRPMTILGSQQWTFQIGGLNIGDVVSGTLQYEIVMRVPAGSP